MPRQKKEKWEIELEKKEKKLVKKAEIVMNSAKIINERVENSEINEDEAIEQMIKFAKSGNFLSFWFDIDEYIRQRNETAKWFWLVRRIRNIKHTL